MAKKRAHQLLVSIESCIVLWLVCSGVDGFLTSTAAGRTLLAFALAGNVSPQQFRDWCRTGRWFSADLVLGTIAQTTVAARHLGSKPALDACALVALFGLMQLFWANGLNLWWDFQLGADRVAGNEGDDKRLAEGKVSLQKVTRQTRSMGLITTILGICVVRRCRSQVAATLLCTTTSLLLAGYSTPPLKFKYRALGEVCLFAWAMCLNALLALVALGLDPLSPKFMGASAVAALLRAYPNFCFNVRDAKTDARVPGLKTVAILLGEEGVRRAYRWSVCVVLPGCAAVLAWVAQTVSDDRLTGGAPVLVSIGLVPHGVAALREPVESWAFYDHTQHVTALMLCVQTAQLLVSS